ncbi:MAG: DUF1579 family protein [Phycisphaerales bacterium]|nr:DUF1579 family protein [Phycisphaerales bacterium]
MKKAYTTKATLVLTTIAAGAFFAGRWSGELPGRALAAQPEGAAQGQPEMDMPMPPVMMLSEEHEHLHAMVGDWSGTMKFKTGDEWMDIEGHVSRELAFDGRFVIEHVKSEFMGQPFEGMGIIGFNSGTKKFESVWVENMATNIAMSTGTYDAKTKTFTFEGEMLDPTTGENRKCLMTMDATDEDRQVSACYWLNADGSKELCMKGEMSRD